MSSLLEQLNSELSALGEEAGRSLVRVHNARGGVGAGTVWHPSGLVLTNAHVVRGRAPRVTLSDGRSFPATVAALDRERDLAALVVEAQDLPAIPIGDSRRLHPGQLVLALGHPFGVIGAAALGVVLSVGRQWAGVPHARVREGPWRTWPAHDNEWVAVSLPLRPGNSGGPLIDTAGRIVGINTIMLGPECGLAVPVHVAKAFLKEALDPQRHVA
jgi:serine protease Do